MLEPTDATVRIAERELNALRPTKINLKLWQISVNFRDPARQPRFFYLDADIQGLDTREQAIAYAEKLLENERWSVITAFPVHYTITKD